MTEEVKAAGEKLLEAIRNTDVYKNKEECLIRIREDEFSRVLLARYESLANQLRMKALSGVESQEEDIREFEKLNTLVYSDELLSEYLVLKMEMETMVAQALSDIMGECGLNVSM